jgi:hypothetical protein
MIHCHRSFSALLPILILWLVSTSTPVSAGGVIVESASTTAKTGWVALDEGLTGADIIKNNAAQISEGGGGMLVTSSSR